MRALGSYGSLIIALLVTFKSAEAQHPGIEMIDQHVEWVGEFPGEDDRAKRGFFRKLGDLLFGSRGALLVKPISIVVTDRGNYFLLDQKSGTILQVQDGNGKVIKGRKKFSDPFPSLVGMCFLPGSQVLFTDSYQNGIYLYTPGKRLFKELNPSMEFRQPTGIAYSEKNDEIWVVETHAHRISVLSRDGSFKRHIGSRGGGPGEFNFPTHIWIDTEGKAYVLDAMNFRVQVLDSEGGFVTAFGKQGDGTGHFAMPKGIATDSEGNIYVADALFHTVQIFDRNGNFLYNFGEQGRGKGQYWMPLNLFIDEDDFVYVADSYNSRIQIFKVNIPESDE